MPKLRNNQLTGKCRSITIYHVKGLHDIFVRYSTAARQTLHRSKGGGCFFASELCRFVELAMPLLLGGGE